jgi:hypothetical protein
LQIVRDEQFNDVLFDGIVSGEEYLVSELSPGNYYWRLLPQLWRMLMRTETWTSYYRTIQVLRVHCL